MVGVVGLMVLFYTAKAQNNPGLCTPGYGHLPGPDPGALQQAENFSGHAFGQVHQGILGMNTDIFYVSAFKAGFICDGTDYIFWFYAMGFPRLNAVPFHAGP